jgi:hypothetical protein
VRRHAQQGCRLRVQRQALGLGEVEGALRAVADLGVVDDANRQVVVGGDVDVARRRDLLGRRVARVGDRESATIASIVRVMRRWCTAMPRTSVSPRSWTTTRMSARPGS